jgi:hypothetical protein
MCLSRGRDEILSVLDSYVNDTYAFQNGLAYVNDDGTVVMKGDNTTWLPEGQNRSRCGPLFILAIPPPSSFAVCAYPA